MWVIQRRLDDLFASRTAGKVATVRLIGPGIAHNQLEPPAAIIRPNWPIRLLLDLRGQLNHPISGCVVPGLRNCVENSQNNVQDLEMAIYNGTVNLIIGTDDRLDNLCNNLLISHFP